MKKRVLVIFGGHNTEYYASCDSVGGMLDELDSDVFEIIKLGVTLEGDWILTDATSEEIKDGESWLKKASNKRAIITPLRNKKALMVIDDDKVDFMDIDCVFPLISGYGGEDGTIQGLLELSGIPYVGSKVAASACGMDKDLTRLYADFCGLKQPECTTLHKKEYVNMEKQVEELVDFGYPVFVKPASQGSSVGISRVDKPEQLGEAIEEAFKYEDKILIEQGILGTEIKVAVLGNENLETGAVCELIVPEGQVNDYAMKHINFTSTKKIPADLKPEFEAEVKKQACDIYRALDCKGFARVDFFLSKEGELYFNEINTVPGIGKHSIYSRMFEATGQQLKNVLTKLINTAFE